MLPSTSGEERQDRHLAELTKSTLNYEIDVNKEDVNLANNQLKTLMSLLDFFLNIEGAFLRNTISATT